MHCQAMIQPRTGMGLRGKESHIQWPKGPELCRQTLKGVLPHQDTLLGKHYPRSFPSHKERVC